MSQPIIYPAGSYQFTPNLGLGLFGADEVVANNFLLIDEAFATAGGSILVNGVSVPPPANLVNSASATLTVVGSNIFIEVVDLGTVTSFSSGNLSPLFTTSVATPTTTPALSFSLSTQAPNQFLVGPEFGPNSAPTFRGITLPDINGVNAQYYPEAYGATHTIGHDDTAAIQAAINAAAANGGGTVVLGPYTYYTSSVLSIINNYVNMRGANQTSQLPPGTGPTLGSVIMCTSASATILQVAGFFVNMIVGNQLSNFQLSRSVKPTGGAVGLNWDYALNTLAYNIGSSDSIYAFYFGNIIGSNNHELCQAYWTPTSTGAGQVYGFYFVASGNNSTLLENCSSSQASAIVPHTALYLNSGNIADLNVYGLSTAFTTVAVSITATDHGTSYFNDDITFTNCIHDSVSVSAYVLTNVYGERSNVQIIGGYVSNSAGASGPLFDIENSSGILIQGVGINGNGAPTLVYLNGPNTVGCVVANNVFYSFSGSSVTGILLNNCSGNTVMGNSLQGYVGLAWTTGIKLTSAAYNIIAGNSLSGYMTTGISVDVASAHNGGLNGVNPANIGTPLADSGSATSMALL